MGSAQKDLIPRFWFLITVNGKTFKYWDHYLFASMGQVEKKRKKVLKKRKRSVKGALRNFP